MIYQVSFSFVKVRLAFRSKHNYAKMTLRNVDSLKARSIGQSEQSKKAILRLKIYTKASGRRFIRFSLPSNSLCCMTNVITLLTKNSRY